MKTLSVSLSALVLLAMPFAAHADTITFQSLTASPSTLDLNTFPAFAYYGDTTASDFQAGYGQGAINAVPTTDANNLGGFTSFTATGGYPDKAPGGIPAISYTNGSGGSNGSSQTGATAFDFVQGAGNGSGFSLTSTLFAPTETLNFYVLEYDTRTDFSVTLGNATYTLLDQVLPSSTGDGSGNSNGVLSLTVTGTIGDVLTFSDKGNYANVSNSSFGNTGIIAVTAVPEPATYAMLLGSFGFLALLVRRRLTV